MSRPPLSSERRELRGVTVLTILFLAVGIMYLVATLESGSDFVAIFYPLLCAVVLLALLTAEAVALVRRAVLTRKAAAVSPAATRQLVDPPSRASALDEDAREPDLTEEAPAGTRWKVFLPLLGAIVAFAYVATQLDYLIGTTAFVFLAIWIIDRKRFSWLWGVVISLLSALVVHLLFVVVLQLYLPTIIPGL